MVSRYYDLSKTADIVRLGQHRSLIGGLWDKIGELQFGYLAKDGLTTDMKLLDVGCGCLRGGVWFVDYLDAGNYYGIDISPDLLEVGYETELTQLGLQSKLPHKNLYCTGDFETGAFSTVFDAAIALSVFTHMPLGYVRQCLTRLAADMRPGGRFYATFFVVPDGADWTAPMTHAPGGIVTYPDRDPYHYRQEDIAGAVTDLPWRLDRVSTWNHPRNQYMAVFERTG